MIMSAWVHQLQTQESLASISAGHRRVFTLRSSRHALEAILRAARNGNAAALLLRSSVVAQLSAPVIMSAG